MKGSRWLAFVACVAGLALVGAAGMLPGLALGAAVPWIVARVAGDALPITPRLALYPLPLVTAAVLGTLVALLFALPALAQARRVPAATLLRDALADIGRHLGRSSAAVAGLLQRGLKQLRRLLAEED